ncbi:MAG TPA: CpsD/CapB family tyrosine-protein kinase [Clostridiaceae bacterium]|jgi:protein-tyrosine kinase|nr:CpsD/CapB family tyrosine-protein kinase [Clostridiaceae bacterium]
MIKKAHNVEGNLCTAAEEAYNVLRSNIQFCGFNKRIKSLVITSCVQGEGKTTTAFNLALSMTRIRLKVLLVDADLRKPLITKYLGNNDSPGLSNLISEQIDFKDGIYTTDVEGLSFMPAGDKPPNPAELLNSVNFDEFLLKAEEQYDIVIFDTPPLGSVIDSAIIASKADGTLLVTKPGSVDYKMGVRVKEQLEKANARILGVVLNGVKKRDYRDYCNYNYYTGNKPRFLFTKWISRLKKYRSS